MNTYRELLKQKDLKATYQRIKVLEFLDKHRIHPTIDEIYHALVLDNPSFSKTTVYNTIEILREHDLVETFIVSSQGLCCDLAQDFHHHFYCEQCQKIYDLDLPCPYLKQTHIQGHQIKSISGSFRGICQECLAKSN